MDKSAKVTVVAIVAIVLALGSMLYFRNSAPAPGPANDAAAAANLPGASGGSAGANAGVNDAAGSANLPGNSGAPSASGANDAAAAANLPGNSGH